VEEVRRAETAEHGPEKLEAEIWAKRNGAGERQHLPGVCLSAIVGPRTHPSRSGWLVGLMG
jgi:hypothetical protein